MIHKKIVLSIIFSFIFILVPSSVVLAADYYISPSGSPTNTGSITSPFDMSVLALTTKFIGGDTVWLRNGMYGDGTTSYSFNAAGNSTAPLTIKQYPGERATINGHISLNGAFVTLWGFEITNTILQRITIDRPTAIDAIGQSDKIINMVIHDVGSPGIGFWQGASNGAEIYGTVFWGNGYYDSDYYYPGSTTTPVQRGVAIYAQNLTGPRYITDNISFRNITEGMKAYSEGGYANNFDFEGNVTFDNGEWNMFVATMNNPISGLILKDNYTYRRPTDNGRNVQLGYYPLLETDANIQNNYFVGGNGTGANPVFFAKWWKNLIFKGNTLVGGILAKYTPTDPSQSTEDWNNNTYYSTSASPFEYIFPTNTQISWNSWRSATSFDSNSTLTKASKPTGVKYFVRPNKYESGRGNVIVYNWSKGTSVAIDVSSILQPGDQYKVIDVQNYYGTPIAQGTYSGGAFSIPMNLTTVAQLVGNVTNIPTATHTAPEFGVFIIQKTGSTTSTPTPTPTGTTTPTPSPFKIGDANGDGQINLQDFTIWLSNFGKILLGRAVGDFNNNGKVDGVDYVLWLINFGK